jgi:hypothetical protein
MWYEFCPIIKPHYSRLGILMGGVPDRGERLNQKAHFWSERLEGDFCVFMEI